MPGEGVSDPTKGGEKGEHKGCRHLVLTGGLVVKMGWREHSVGMGANLDVPDGLGV